MTDQAIAHEMQRMKDSFEFDIEELRRELQRVREELREERDTRRIEDNAIRDSLEHLDRRCP